MLKLCKNTKWDASHYKTLERHVQIWSGDEIEDSFSIVNKQLSFQVFTHHRFAFFDPEEFNIEVKITENIHPGHFYVQIVKFNNQLERLEERLKVEYEDFTKKNLGRYNPFIHILFIFLNFHH